MTHQITTQKNESPSTSSRKITPPANIFTFVGKIIILVFFFLFILSAAFAYAVFTAPKTSENPSIFTQIKHLITSPDRKLRGEEENRINVLLLGIGGEKHEGPLLTDTMIFISFRPSDKRAAIMSIPRDLLVDIPSWGKAKINHAYAIGESREGISGGALASQVVEEVFEIPVHYYFRIDFNGFVKLIDSLGGITVNVERTLNDPFYPVEGKEDAPWEERYEHLVIEKGIRYMNGETALKYVRSRMALGAEGNDFARSRRQQKILLALKEKIFSASTILNVRKLNNIISFLQNHIDTNMEIWEIARLYEVGKDVSSSNITNIILDDSPEGILRDAYYEGAFVLVPKNPDGSELKEVAKNIFDPDIIHTISLNRPEEYRFTPETEKTESKKSSFNSFKIQIHNGTNITGLAAKTQSFLTKKGFTIVSIGNAPKQSYKKTLIYDLLSDGVDEKEKRKLLKELENIFDAVIFTSGKPLGIVDDRGETRKYPVNDSADILIILGSDWEEKLHAANTL